MTKYLHVTVAVLLLSLRQVGKPAVPRIEVMFPKGKRVNFRILLSLLSFEKSFRLGPRDGVIFFRSVILDSCRRLRV